MVKQSPLTGGRGPMVSRSNSAAFIVHSLWNPALKLEAHAGQVSAKVRDVGSDESYGGMDGFR